MAIHARTLKSLGHYAVCTFMSPKFWRLVIDRVLVALTILFILMVAQVTLERTHVIDVFAYALAELINHIKIGKIRL